MCATRFLRISAANIGPNRFHQNRTVSWLMSIPRSARRSSTLRSDSGYLTYIITTRRMTSGELLKYRNGLRMAEAYRPAEASPALCLTEPCRVLVPVIGLPLRPRLLLVRIRQQRVRFIIFALRIFPEPMTFICDDRQLGGVEAALAARLDICEGAYHRHLNAGFQGLGGGLETRFGEFAGPALERSNLDSALSRRDLLSRGPLLQSRLAGKTQKRFHLFD